ncbi:recombinase family protein [Mesorhizobium sp. M7A.F.Ca.MR.148.00.0.0]|uniref:recombinase family protein n=1 Tax=Mesorhizobium sp. M7A.F.Ca.MR.148.00.0.0 TaxID=2496775 RepID=UPI000FCB9452|nr:recombinase family protein [Mesorhizobium sp. M7A.F.Ca.MR.148.00.0.0]RUV32642.1 recombinase family protein [Mesorhizobium sp. M7A.F.Ca.MR.148.00.0.0]
MSKTILYARVSTADQTLSHQRTQAEAAGFKIDKVIADEGVSGVSTKLAERPEGKRLFDILRPGDTLVVRWVDRLGRDYQDVSDSIRHFMRDGVIIKTVINGMVFDGATKDPIQQAVRDALIAFMAATAEAQAVATKEAQKAGIEAARADPKTYRGRKPSYDRGGFDQVARLLDNGAGASAIAKETGLTRQTVLRIKGDRVGAEKALALWDSSRQ